MNLIGLCTLLQKLSLLICFCSSKSRGAKFSSNEERQKRKDNSNCIGNITFAWYNYVPKHIEILSEKYRKRCFQLSIFLLEFLVYRYSADSWELKQFPFKLHNQTQLNYYLRFQN